MRAFYLILEISRTDLWSQGIFLKWRSKTSAALKFKFIDSQTLKADKLSSVLLQIFMGFLTIVFLSAHIWTELWSVKQQFFSWKQEPENTILLI